QKASKGGGSQVSIPESTKYLESIAVTIELGKPRTSRRQVYTAFVTEGRDGKSHCHHTRRDHYGDSNTDLMFSVCASEFTDYIPWLCLVNRGIRFIPRHPDYSNPNSEDDQRGLLSALASHNLAPWYK